MKKFLLLILGCLALLPGYSQSFDYNGIAYEITSESDKTCEVTRNSGISGDIIIPEKVTYEGTEYSVTSIGENAFSNCSGLSSIEIPNSVYLIRGSAFESCSGLTNITIPNSVTIIGDRAFEACNSLTSINVDNENPSYESEGGVLYSKNLQTIIQYPAGLSGNFVIPQSVTIIGDYAFRYCTGLTSIEIPNSVTSIRRSAFSYCTGLTSVVIPNSVTSIGAGAFSGCSGLTSIEIPNSVTSIGDRAFWRCSGLTSVEIPNSVTSIESEVFRDCSGLKSIEIPNSVTSIGGLAFCDCSGLTSIEIPNSVTSIGDGAFWGCSGLTSIEIPNSVTSIVDYAFYGCSGLTGNLIIPNSVTSIGERAFGQCSGLTSMAIGNSVTSIGYSAFVGCSGLTGKLIIPNSVTSIEREAFYGCHGLTSIEIPNSVTSIGEGAFYLCEGLTNVEIPNSVTSIGNAPFAYCSSLNSINVDNENPSYESEGGVLYSKNLQTIIQYPAGLSGNFIIPNSVTSIGDRAFYGCTGLTSVEIPNSVTSIGENAFYPCFNLDCRIVMPTLLQSFDIKSFEDTPATLVFTNRNLSITGDIIEFRVYPTYYAAGDTYEQLSALVPAEYVFLLNDAVLDETSPVFIGANSECTWESTADYQLASGFQFDLTLPQGLTIRNISAGENSDNPDNVEIAFSQVANGDYRVIGYSKDASEIGVLTLAFEFVSDGSLQRGDILCHNAVMSISDRQLDCTDQTVAVTGYNITIDLPETLMEGDSITLPSPFGTETASVAYTWSTENPAIATVEGNETLHAKNAGVTNVLLTVEDPAFTKTFTTPIEVLAALWGDVDGNGVCNVQDLVAMVNYILERHPANFDTNLADIDRNGSINVVDLTALIRIILSYEDTEKMHVRGVYGRSSTSDITFGEVSANKPGLYTLPIIITPAEDYTALQADITLPEGLTIENITLGAALKSHTLDYSVTGKTSARFIVYSTSLAPIAPAEDGVLANLTLSGTTEGEIGIDDILACDTSCNGYQIAGTARELGDTTGIGAVGSENATFDIFTLEGVCLKQGATLADVDGLAPGIYIIGGKKVIVK